MTADGYDFARGMIAGLACAGVGSLTTFIWMLYRLPEGPAPVLPAPMPPFPAWPPPGLEDIDHDVDLGVEGRDDAKSSA